MATTMTTIELAHPVQVVTADLVDGLGHRAECSCGWASDWTDHPATAEAAGVDHRDQAAGPGDGLDAVMSELLDIQDDLAAVVVWLAENWSADLPVPVVYGRDGGADDGGGAPARVEVSAYCLDLGDLTRIARLVGVPSTDDEQPNTYGSRYRTVRRDFGRVTLRAFTAIETDMGPVS
jgi:hypothetical protein